MFGTSAILELSELFLQLLHASGYAMIMGSALAFAVKLARRKAHRSDGGALATAERRITLLCCITFMLAGIATVVFFNSI